MPCEPFDMTRWERSPLNHRIGVPPRHKVAIIGPQPCRGEAPTDDPDWDVWGMNAVYSFDTHGRFRADAWFEMHQRVAQTDDDLVWIRKCPVPIYVPDAEMAALNPLAIVYPIHAIERTYRPYWACTFAYQLALALFKGYHEVGIYGVDLSRGYMRERTVEWANLSWWAGFLEGHCVKVTVPDSVPLGRHGARYGIEYAEEKALVEDYVAQSKLSLSLTPGSPEMVECEKRMTDAVIRTIRRSIG